MPVITEQMLIDAAADAQSLEDIVNGAENFNGTGLVTTRLGGDIKTVSKILADLEDEINEAGEGWLDLAEGFADAAEAAAVLTAADAIQTAADRVQTGLDRTATGNDKTATNADVVLTHADVVLTHADVVLTHADVVSTGNDASSTAADAIQTAADRVQTGLDAAQTAADRVQTGLDAASAAASALAAAASAAGFSLKQTCRLATTANLTATYSNGSSGVGATLTNSGAQAAFSLDGITPAVGTRILVKDQSTASRNGIYTLTTAGSGASNWVLTRATDYDQAAEILDGTAVLIEEGTVNTGTLWIANPNATVTVGTTSIPFIQLVAAAVNLTGAITSIGATTSLGSFTSAQLLAALTNGTGTGAAVFATNPTLDAPVLNNLPTGTGVASGATASTLASRNSNANTSFNNILLGYTTTATAAGTTTLTVASTFRQYFTGSTTQTVALPVTSTLVLGQDYLIVNRSTGIVTINSSGGNQVTTLAPGEAAFITCILTSGTTAASWDVVKMSSSIAGNVIQVVQSTKTDTTSINSTTPAAISGMSVAITPSSTSNKVLVRAMLNIGTPSNDDAFIFLQKGGSDITGATGDAASSRVRATTQAFVNGSTAAVISVMLEFLDSPATTSSITYSLSWRSLGNAACYLNRSVDDTNSSLFGRFMSSITAMEIKG